MSAKDVLSTLAGVLFVGGYVPYIRAILRGETKPSKASWIIWISLDIITLVGMFLKDAAIGQIFGAAVGGLAVVVLSLKYGTPGWTNLDKFCLTGAVLGIVLWLTFNDAIFGIVTSQAVVLLGAFPTFTSAWKDPSREDRLAWTLFWISCVLAVIAIPQWTLEESTQPITFFTIETTMMYILYFRARSMTRLK